MVEAVDGVIDAHPGRTVAAVCHGGTINAYLSAMLGIDRLMFFLPGLHQRQPGPGVPRRRARGLVSINETGHLRFAKRSP